MELVEGTGGAAPTVLPLELVFLVEVVPKTTGALMEVGLSTMTITAGGVSETWEAEVTQDTNNWMIVVRPKTE